MAHRKPLLDLLADYLSRYPEESQVVTRYREFVETEPECFHRELAVGHVTGSAWVVDPAGDSTLLTHHATLDRWLQLGGHADGNPDVRAVALCEAREESGLADFDFVLPGIFDVDIHAIPERHGVPRHLHYDVRFLLLATRTDFVVGDESHDLAWVPMSELSSYTSEPSMLRMSAKAGHALSEHS